MGPLGFSQTLLWVSLFDADGYPTPTISQIDDMPDVLTEEDTTDLLEFCATHLDHVTPGGSVAVLRSRPGPAKWTEDDRAWGRSITRGARAARIRVHPFHLANDQELRVFTPDDLNE